MSGGVALFTVCVLHICRVLKLVCTMKSELKSKCHQDTLNDYKDDPHFNFREITIDVFISHLLNSQLSKCCIILLHSTDDTLQLTQYT